MSVTGHRSKVMKKQALCQNGKMHIATNSPYFGLQDKASSGPIKKKIKQKIKTTERIVKGLRFCRKGRGGYWEG